MKILVMVKQVPDTATQVKISADPKAIETTGITWIVSPYDEFAVEEALRIKEKRAQGEVVAVSGTCLTRTRIFMTLSLLEVAAESRNASHG